MTKLAVLGDFHMPERASEIPKEFRAILETGKFDKILCTGDLTDHSLLSDWEKYAPMEVVQGNMDSFVDKFPDSKVFNFGKHKIGLIHGKGVYPRGDETQLVEIANELKVDILIQGHTHKSEIKKIQGKLFLNPGSITGAWGGGDADNIPSFIILELNAKIKIKLIQLVNSKINEKIQEFNLLGN